MALVTFVSGLALALVLWQWDRSREDSTFAEARQESDRRPASARRSELLAERNRVAARRFRPSLLDRFALWCAAPRRLVLLAPLPVGLCLLAVHRGIAGLVFLLGVPPAALYLALVTHAASSGGDA